MALTPKEKKRGSILHSPRVKSAIASTVVPEYPRRAKLHKGEAQKRLNEYGLDAICEELRGGETLTGIAKSLGIEPATIVNWIAADPQRSARTKIARSEAAALWDERAVVEIKAADDKFELDKARELATHYRWRASKLAPKEYGDRVAHEHEGEITVLSADQRKARLTALMSKTTVTTTLLTAESTREDV